MSLKILIVEDEYLGMERLERQLHSLEKGLEIVGKADSVVAAIRWLETNAAPDLIFMDIDLGDGQSFEIFTRVIIQSHVIFTTSYDEHALQAFQLNNIDYLLKPIRKSELGDAIEKYIASDLFGSKENNEIESLVSSLKKQLINGFRQRFLAREGKKIISVELHQVAYFFTEDQRNYLRTRDKKKLQIEHSMDEIETCVDPGEYFRVNERWIIHNESIAKMHHHPDGQFTLQLRPGADKQVFVESKKIGPFKSWAKK